MFLETSLSSDNSQMSSSMLDFILLAIMSDTFVMLSGRRW